MPRGKKAGSGVNKMDAVRQAIAALGTDLTPSEIIQFLKDKFGVNMSPNMASKYRGMILKKMGHKTRGRQPGRKPAAAPTGNTGAAASAISLDDIRAVSELVQRMGADRVRQLAEVLAR